MNMEKFDFWLDFKKACVVAFLGLAYIDMMLVLQIFIK